MEDDPLLCLRRDVATLFVLSPSGRIIRENDPDRSEGPKLFFAGCRSGNLVYLHEDVSDPAAAQIPSLFAGEPPWLNPETHPLRLARAMDLLAREMPVAVCDASLIYALPRLEATQSNWRFICSGTDEAEALLDALQREGMPRHMVEAGFASIRDFWPPWCVGIESSAIASIALAARLGADGAEVSAPHIPWLAIQGPRRGSDGEVVRPPRSRRPRAVLQRGDKQYVLTKGSRTARPAAVRDQP